MKTKSKRIKKSLLYLLLLSLSSFGTGSNDVYICKSKNAKRYHLIEDCRGLKNCKAEVVKVTLQECEAQGKTLCGYED